jgi:hypothetical protein
MKEYGRKSQVTGEKAPLARFEVQRRRPPSKAGADLRFVHEWLGHTILRSTAIYVYLAASPLQGGLHVRPL